MKVLLLKLLLLLLFLALLFLVLRVLERVAWYETGLVISQVMDPLSLSVRKLKVLLDGRGISYDGVVEKQELAALVQASGDVMEGELLLLEQESEEEAAQSTSFSSGPHFYEEVEDKKDSIWLVQVKPRGHVPLLERDTWKTVVKRVSHFGIRTGMFDCTHDSRFCQKKGWTQPILMLAMPQGLNQKDNVIMATYPSSNLKASKVIKWVSTRLASTVDRVEEGRLVREWLEASQTQPKVPPIQLVFLSEEEGIEAPLFFSAISLKYSGRVKFGQAFLRKSTQNLLSGKFQIKTSSSQYLVTTPEGVVTYGRREGEYMNHRAMNMYLGTLYPQANDFFLLSFIVGNMLCVLELVINRGDVLAKRVFHFLWVWVKYNVVLIVLWLPLLALTQISFLNPVFQFCQKALRLSSQTTLASHLRCVWIMHSHQGGLIVLSFFVFCAVIGFVQSCRGDSDQGGTSSRDWLRSTLIYYYSMLVRPSPGYTPVLMSNARLEEGMHWDRVINQAMFPNLFLLANIAQDYLEDLPTWRYRQREVTDKWLTAEKCHSYRCTCFPDDEKHRQENCQLLEYLKEQDKCRVGGKYGKRGRKHACRNCLGRLGGDPKRSEPFLVTDCCGISDTSHKMAPETCPNTPSSPENIGSLAFGNTNPETKTVKSSLTEKPDHENKLCEEGSDESPKLNIGPHALKAMCNCGLETNQSPDLKSNSDPWPEGTMESTECSICLEPYAHGVELCGLPCGHAFHQGCIMVWLTSNSNHCCPNCRWPAYKTRGSKLSKHKE